MIMLTEALEKRDLAVAGTARALQLPALLTRLYLGYFFFETGLAKVQDLSTMTERFMDWGIPAPAFNAALSGYTELLGGALIVLGLCTRLSCVPMIINMVVAVLAVKLRGVETLNDFVELDEPLYALGFLWLLIAGPGKLSLDHLVLSALRRESRRSQPALPDVATSRV
jgi:putative oxidoreductase